MDSALEITASIEQREREGEMEWVGPDDGVLGISYELHEQTDVMERITTAFPLKEIGRNEDQQVVYFQRAK